MTGRDNPVHLSDATDASTSGSRPKKDDNFDNEAKLLGHYSDALREMAASIMDLEDGYFKALYEVIMETKRALRDISCIDAHYVSQVVMVMSSRRRRCRPLQATWRVLTPPFTSRATRMHRK